MNEPIYGLQFPDIPESEQDTEAQSELCGNDVGLEQAGEGQDRNPPFPGIAEEELVHAKH